VKNYGTLLLILSLQTQRCFAEDLPAPTPISPHRGVEVAKHWSNS